MYYDQEGWTHSLGEVLSENGCLVIKIDSEYQRKIA